MADHNDFPADSGDVVADWQRSSYCSATTCVEIGRTASGGMLLRDSKDVESRPAVVIDRGFLELAKMGLFDVVNPAMATDGAAEAAATAADELPMGIPMA